MRKLIGVIALLTLFTNAHSTTLPDFPFVVSTGIAERDVKPDLAEVTIWITAFNEDSSTAKNDADIAFKSVLDIFEEHTVDIKKVEASDYRKRTIRKRDSEYNNLEIMGYEVFRTITTHIDDMKEYASIAESLVSVNNVSNLRTSFDISERAAVEKELTQAASDNARERAEVIAESLDVSIRSVYAVSQSSDFGGFMATFGASDSPILANAPRRDSGSATMFVPESITVKQTVNVVFRIKP
jgi:uncharacterized protein YggE